MNEQLATIERQQLAPLTAKDVLNQVKLIQEIMRDAMKDKEHFGTIPGCGDKKVLFKAGAEKLCLTFRMAPKFEIQETNLPNGHKEYRVVCSMHSIGNGQFLGSGVGTGSTMESKYRYRHVSDYEVLEGESIPQDYKERKGEYAKQGFGAKKIGAVWAWVKYKEGEKTENPDPADCYNTVLKMGKKRALVDAILTATAASDIFTQDLLEVSEEIRVQEAAEEAPHKPVSDAPKAPPAHDSAPKGSGQPKPAQEAQNGEDGEVIESLVKDLEVVDNPKFDPSQPVKNKNWKQRYAVVLEDDPDGRKLGFFSDTIAEIMDAAKRDGLKVRVRVKSSGRFHNVEAAELLDDIKF